MPLQFNYEPHEAQRRLHADRHRFQTVCCGRRWGKTRFAAAKMIDEGGGVAGGDYGWIAPTYLIAERGLEALREGVTRSGPSQWRKRLESEAYEIQPSGKSPSS